MPMYSYEEATGRNAAFILKDEQEKLRNTVVAIAGMGGVGSSHAIALARLGFSKFKIADLDHYEVSNFNRQAGAFMSTLNKSKVDVIKKTLLDINPEAEVEVFKDGITLGNAEEFLKGVDVYVDGLDFFVMPIRRLVFGTCHKLGIPATTAAPAAWGVTCMSFSEDTKITFDAFFDLHDDMPMLTQYLHFYIGLRGKNIFEGSLMDEATLDLVNQDLSVTTAGISAATAAIVTEVVKIVLQRGNLKYVPYFFQYDFYNQKFAQCYLPKGNQSMMQKIKIRYGKRVLRKRYGEKATF